MKIIQLKKKKKLGKWKYFPFVCAIIYYAIGIYTSNVVGTVFFQIYPIWWINLVIPVLFLLIDVLPIKVIELIKHLVRYVVYFEIIASLSYVVYIQFNQLQFLGELTYWAYFRIPAFQLFERIYYFWDCIVHGYLVGYLILQVLGEVILLLSYISSYYLAKHVLREDEKIDLIRFMQKHVKLIFSIIVIMVFVFVKILMLR